MSGRHRQLRATTAAPPRRSTPGRPVDPRLLTPEERAALEVALDRLLGLRDWPNRHVAGGA